MGDKRKGANLITILMAAAALLAAFLRSFYVYYTPSWMRQHDVIGFGAGDGQAAFIEYFYQGHLLIDFDPREKWGFFQPPLHHMLSALWIHLQEFLGFTYEKACENVQILTLIFSFITLYFSYLIFRYFRLEGEGLITAFAIAAVHPGFILMAGSVNNDMLAIMFSVMTIYYALKWNEDPKWRYTVALALTIGLGMMAKLSAALVAPAVALIFVVKWIHAGTDGFVSHMKKFVVFSIICVPLGLWSPIRNMIRFGVPVGFTPGVGEPVNAPLWQRIFDVRTGKPFVCLEKYGDPYNEFNIFLGMIKTSLFGDQDFAIAMTEAGHGGIGAGLITAFGWGLFLSGVILAILCLRATVHVLCFKYYIARRSERAFLAVVYLISVAVYIRFMLVSGSYSSMDFRYVLYLIPVEALMAGVYMKESRGWYRRVTEAALAVFVLSTAAVYTMLSLAG